VKIPHGDIKITLKHTMKEEKLNGPSTVEFFIKEPCVVTVSYCYACLYSIDYLLDKKLRISACAVKKKLGKFVIFC